MKEKDEIADLFHSKLSDHAESVDPALWTKVQAGLHVSAAASTAGAVVGKSIGLTKALLITGGIIVATSVVGVWLIKQQPDSDQQSTAISNQNGGKVSSNSPITVEQNQLASPNHTVPTSQKNQVTTKSPAVSAVKQDQDQSNSIENGPSSGNSEKALVENPAVAPIVDSKSQQSVGTTNQLNESYRVDPVVQENPKIAQDTPLIHSIPNVFTPNADGKNDLFSIPVKEGIAHVTKVFNTKGDLIATFDEKSSGWDGTILGGSEAANGTYFYVTFVSDSFGNKQPYKGTIQLIR